MSDARAKGLQFLCRGFDILRWRYGTPSLRTRDQVTLSYVAQGVYLIFYVFIYAAGNSHGILRRFLPAVFWVIRITTNSVKYNCLFYCCCNNMFRPKGPASCSAFWPNVVVFGCTLILIDFGISGSMFSMHLTQFELRRVCSSNSICCWHIQTLCGSHRIYTSVCLWVCFWTSVDCSVTVSLNE